MKYTTYLLIILSWVSFNTLTQSDVEQRKEYLAALNELTPYLPQISVTKWTEYLGNTTIYHTEYLCNTNQAKKALTTYQSYLSKMENKKGILWLGGIAGLIGAISSLSISANTKKSNPLPLVLIWAFLPAIVGIHNKQKKALPYYDNDLKYKKNYFGLKNSIADAFASTFLASILTLAGLTLGEEFTH